MNINKPLFESLQHFIDSNFQDEQSGIKSSIHEESDEYSVSSSSILFQSEDILYQPSSDLESAVSSLEETFSQALFRNIREKQLSEVETYKAAHMDRKLFSKIRSNDHYVPGRKTAIAFALALQLNIDESMTFLKTAGITLSHSSKFDLIIEYFIKNETYDIFEINKALYDFGQELLGS